MSLAEEEGSESNEDVSSLKEADDHEEGTVIISSDPQRQKGFVSLFTFIFNLNDFLPV